MMDNRAILLRKDIGFCVVIIETIWGFATPRGRFRSTYDKDYSILGPILDPDFWKLACGSCFQVMFPTCEKSIKRPLP